MFAFQITNSVNSSRYFIGLTDMENEGTFLWESGSPLSTDVASFWKTGHPNGGQRDNCVSVKDGHLWDIRCNQALRFVCQKRISSESSNGNL